MVSRFIATACALLVAAAVVLVAQQPDRTRTEALSRRAGDRMAALRVEAERLAAEERTLLGDLRRLEVARELKGLEFDRARQEAEAVADEVATLDAQVAAIRDEARAALPDLRARLVTLYKLGKGRYARLLLSASDSRQLAQAVRLASALAEQDRQRITAYQRRLEMLGAASEAARGRHAQLQQLEATAATARAEADRAVAAHLSLVRDISTQRDLNARFSEELQLSQRRLQAALAGFATSAATALPIGPFKGDLDWPVPGTVRQRFGTTRDGRPASRGMEIEAPEGSAVHAVHDGRVVFADAFAGFGRLVILDHGGQTFTLYGNLGDVQVAQGTVLAHGEPVGTVGLASDGSGGVYFELRVDGQPVDPLEWLTKR